MKRRQGFTLIELLVVIIIVGILASVAIPMMRGNVQRAQRSEAVAALGSLRTAQRAYYAEYSVYASDKAQLTAGGFVQNLDFAGKYFIDADYTVSTTTLTASNANAGTVTMDVVTGAITGG